MTSTPLGPGESDLKVLLATMAPYRRPGAFVFVVCDDPTAAGIEVFASVREAEGLTVVTTQADADRAGLPYAFVAAWLTLEVHSDLAAVGLTAAFSAALTQAQISCNVLAGYYHDHLLVPIDRVDGALAALRSLVESAPTVA